MSALRVKHLDGAHALKPNAKQQAALDARIAEHGEELVWMAWEWMLTCKCGDPRCRATFLRDGGYANFKTFLRPDNCAEYIDLAGQARARARTATPTASGTPTPANTPMPVAPALAAWADLEALTANGYHSQRPPTALDHADPARDLRLRRALSTAGGWVAFCQRDRFTAGPMRAAFVAAFERTPHMEAAK